MLSDRKPSLILPLAGLVLVLAAYVLSIGPAWRYVIGMTCAAR